ncbi:monofunctional biosynthetic peptidoglycan transglycosylase, partial [Pseudomonas aeruginosa]
RTQASQLAAVLPSPLKWSAARPGPYVRQRAAWIRQQMWQLGGDDYLLRLER